MSEPRIIKVRSWGFRNAFWEVTTLDSTGHHRYSYWSKSKYPDEMAAYAATMKLISTE